MITRLGDSTGRHVGRGGAFDLVVPAACAGTTPRRSLSRLHEAGRSYGRCPWTAGLVGLGRPALRRIDVMPWQRIGTGAWTMTAFFMSVGSS